MLRDFYPTPLRKGHPEVTRIINNTCNAKNAVRIFRVENISEYSKLLEKSELLDHAKYRQNYRSKKNPNSSIPFIVSTCVYSPQYFYKQITNRLNREIDSTNNDRLKNDFQRFEESLEKSNSIDDINHDIISKTALKRVEKEFTRVARRRFPHFNALKRHDNVVRVCLLRQDISEWRNVWLEADGVSSYREHLAGHVDPAAAYAFLHWLNGENKCYVADPWCWEYIGLKQNPRDFAILNAEVLIEFHERAEMFVLVDPINKADWKYADIEEFKRKSKSSYFDTNCSSFSDFFDSILFGGENRLNRYITVINTFKSKVMSEETLQNLERIERIEDISNRTIGILKDMKKVYSKNMDEINNILAKIPEAYNLERYREVKGKIIHQLINIENGLDERLDRIS